MNPKDQLRFQSLIDDSNIAKAEEMQELIRLARDLKGESNALIVENQKLKSNRHTFWSVTLDHYNSWDAVGFWCSLWVLPALLLLITAAGFLIFASHDTNEYGLEYHGADKCTRVVRIVEWGGDFAVSECFDTSDEALQFLISLENAHVTHKAEKEIQRGDQAQEAQDLGRSGSLVPELSRSNEGQEERER